MTDEPTKVVLTRKRWDAYMLPLFIVVIFVAAFLARQSGQLRFVGAPLGVLSLWAMLRFTTPRDGMAVKTIRSTPGLVVLLWCSATGIVLFGLLVAIDVYLLDYPFHAPLEPYHALLLAPPFMVFLLGPIVVDRVQKRWGNPSV